MTGLHTRQVQSQQNHSRVTAAKGVLVNYPLWDPAQLISTTVLVAGGKDKLLWLTQEQELLIHNQSTATVVATVVKYKCKKIHTVTFADQLKYLAFNPEDYPYCDPTTGPQFRENYKVSSKKKVAIKAGEFHVVKQRVYKANGKVITPVTEGNVLNYGYPGMYGFFVVYNTMPYVGVNATGVTGNTGNVEFAVATNLASKIGYHLIEDNDPATQASKGNSTDSVTMSLAYGVPPVLKNGTALNDEADTAWSSTNYRRPVVLIKAVTVSAEEDAARDKEGFEMVTDDAS